MQTTTETLNTLVALAAETHEQMRRTAERAAQHHRELVARLDMRAP
jgi:D-alanine-D-alanine ligase-like ATP-grasp enzyme